MIYEWDKQYRQGRSNQSPIRLLFTFCSFYGFCRTRTFLRSLHHHRSHDCRTPFPSDAFTGSRLGLPSVVALILLHLISWDHTLLAVTKGIDVYLFLAGMMLLAELAQWEGVFNWLASWAVRAANKSASRLFLLIYCVGTIVTVFLSNDATAVVLTPAVYAAVRKAKVDALPYLLACAFIANAASFVLPDLQSCKYRGLR